MKRVLYLAVSAALLGSAGSALAITDSETNASIPFSFSSPGARSLGMAGAFLGLADDATAAYTNPAGLTQLVQTEISLEARHTSYDTPYMDGADTTTSPFRIGNLGVGEAHSSNNNLSYVSLVVPRERWSFSLYRHELARFETDFTTLKGAIVDDDFRVFPFRSIADLKIVSLGAAAGFKASDNVSLGFGITNYDFRFDTRTLRVDDRDPDNVVLAASQGQLGDDRGYGFNLGARFKLNDHFSLGATYRKAPSLHYDAANILLADDDGTLPSPVVLAVLRDVKFDIPDIFGVGVSWRPVDALVVNLDVNRVMYSQLTDDIRSLFNIQNAANGLYLEDGTEVRLGAEYTFANMAAPFSLRGGFWHDPRHSVAYRTPPSDVAGSVLATLFAGGRGSENHFAVGGGWAFKSFQLDFGADFSDGLDTYSASGVYRF